MSEVRMLQLDFFFISKIALKPYSHAHKDYRGSVYERDTGDIV